VLKLGKRAMKWVPKPYSKVSWAFEKKGSDGVDGVP